MGRSWWLQKRQLHTHCITKQLTNSVQDLCQLIAVHFKDARVATPYDQWPMSGTIYRKDPYVGLKASMAPETTITTTHRLRHIYGLLYWVLTVLILSKHCNHRVRLGLSFLPSQQCILDFYYTLYHERYNLFFFNLALSYSSSSVSHVVQFWCSIWSTLVVILSSGGLALTLFQQPANTHKEAVTIIFTSTGIGTTAEAPASRNKASRALDAGFLISAPSPSTAGTLPTCAMVCYFWNGRLWKIRSSLSSSFTNL